MLRFLENKTKAEPFAKWTVKDKDEWIENSFQITTCNNNHNRGTFPFRSKIEIVNLHVF